MKILHFFSWILKLCILISLFASSDAEEENNSKIREVKYASKVTIDVEDFPVSTEKIEIVLEHPRIYLGGGYSSSYSDGGVNYPDSYTKSFDGLFVMVDSNCIIINDKQFALGKLPKSIWISGDLKIIKVDNKVCDFQKVLLNNKLLDKDYFERTPLDNGYTLEFKGGFSNGSGVGVGIDDSHYIIVRSGIVVRIWGDSIYVWDRFFGKISELADKDKKIHFELVKLLK